MSLIASDLVTDLDVLALDARATTDFGAPNATLSEKRRVAVQDWLRPMLEQSGYKPWRHMTRAAADTVYTQISSVLADVTGAAADSTSDDVTLGAVFVGSATNALYLGRREPFRGLAVDMLETVNAVTAVASLTYWNGGAWAAPSSLVDGTIATTGKSFSGGGRITWSLPDDWTPRAFGSSIAYWARVTCSNTLTTGTAAGAIVVLARSRLTYPAAAYTLSLLYREGVGSSRGDWQAKADDYERRASEALTRALPLIADEFDIDASQAVTRTEINSVRRVTDRYWLHTLERG